MSKARKAFVTFGIISSLFGKPQQSRAEFGDSENNTPVPVRTVDFRVDTLSRFDHSAAYFLSEDKSITVNYIEGEDNTFNESKSVKAHEEKHRDNSDARAEYMPVGLEEYYKICCHDEISANIVGLLQLREEYRNAKNQEERDSIANSPAAGRYRYYFAAVEEGKINPFAENVKEFDEEMAFIANETQKMWMSKFGKSYDVSHVSMVFNYYNDNVHENIRPNPDNYEKICESFYTIGGIDFRKYLKEDIECINPSVQEADSMLAAGNYAEAMQKITFLANDEDSSSFEFLQPAYLAVDDMSLEQQLSVRQHQLFITNLLNENPGLIEKVSEVMSDAACEDGEIRLCEKYGIAIAGDIDKDKLPKIAGAMYLVHFFKRYGEKLNNDPQLKEYWNKAVEQSEKWIVLDNKGKYSLPKENNELYNKTLDELYTQNGVNIKEIFTTASLSYTAYIPKYEMNEIKKIENQSGMRRVLNRFFDFMDSIFSKIDNFFKEHGQEPKRRISPMQQENIYDFRQDILAKQCEEAASKETSKEQTKSKTKEAAGRVKRKLSSKEDNGKRVEQNVSLQDVNGAEINYIQNNNER